ncbi:hypothetical protein A1O1_00444, partial [Capronia coronata CBS 617.96]
MCQVESHKSQTCGHKWATIVEQCHKGAGFSKTSVHPITKARTGLCQPRYISAPAGSCPNCDKKGDYDANGTRMILGKRDRGTLGNGYTMTDGYGKPLPMSGSYPYGYSVTACGM